MTKWFHYARLFHRLLVLIISVLILFMAGTGLLMKYSSFSSEHLTFIDLGATRYLHNQLSIITTVVFVIMAITGLLMYFIPPLIRRRRITSKPETVDPAS